MTCWVDGCYDEVSFRGLCNGHFVQLKLNDCLPGTRNKEIINFIKSVISINPDICVEWPYQKVKAAHGVYGLACGTTAHRKTLKMSGSPPPTKRHIAAHKPIVCHNTLCITPKHLRWATYQENMDDRVIDKTLARGSSIGISKLNTDDVIEIKKMFDDNSDAAIAEKYSVTPGNIYAIRKGKSWGWVDQKQ